MTQAFRVSFKQESTLLRTRVCDSASTRHQTFLLCTEIRTDCSLSQQSWGLGGVRFFWQAWGWRDKQAHSHCANQLNYSDDSLSVDITLLQNVNTDMFTGQIFFFFFSRDLKGRVSHSETESSTAGCWPQSVLARLCVVTFCYSHKYMQFGSGKELQSTVWNKENTLSVSTCRSSRLRYSCPI